MYERNLLEGSRARHAPLDATSSSCISDCRFFGGEGGGIKTGSLVKDPNSLAEAENAITQELYELSMKEREGALHDVHGVADEVEESPELVRSRLNELKVELGLARYATSEAFRIAMAQSSLYVRGLYLMFLRCELFNVRLAAERMMRHFDMKRELFGVDKLGRDITLSDFSANDKKCLESGFLQLLPQRDRSGRVVFVKIWYEQSYAERENVWRSIWYLEMTMLKDELTQKKGKVSILYNVTPRWIESFDRELFRGVGRLKKASAVRTAAAHYCFVDPAFGAIIKFITVLMDRKTRTRTRLHQGTHVEVQYDLMSFGIPMSALPLSSEGTMRRKDHLKWIKMRQKHEMLMHNLQPPPHVVLIPAHIDVLFGRGKIYQLHLGNMRLSHLLEEESARYFEAKREDKAGISLELVLRMKKDGTRFLRQEKDGPWVEVDDKTAADKVGHGFRNRKPVKPPSVEKQKEKRIPSPSTVDSSHPVIQQCIASKRLRFYHDKQ